MLSNTLKKRYIKKDYRCAKNLDTTIEQKIEQKEKSL